MPILSSCNVGDVITLTLPGAPVDGGGYTYIWKWWDGTTTVTRIPTVDKQLNVGGTLSYTLIQCDALGRSHSYAGVVTVNFPPVVIGSPSITENDTSFPFSSLLSSVSYDPEHPGSTELSFAWYNGASLISAGTTVVLSPGTYRNQLGVDGIDTDRTLTQVITDTSNGVTRVNYPLRGFEPSGLQGSSSTISNSIVSSANNLSQITIGPGQEATFTAYAQDSSPGQLRFIWTAGTLNGWSSDFTFQDTPSPLQNGLFKSQIVRSVNLETPGLKTVTCEVTNLETDQSISFNTAVNLISPKVPIITSISTDAPIINGGYAVSQAGFVHFSATAVDPNNALLSYKWTFTQPPVVLYGQTVMLRPADYSVFGEDILTGNGTDPGTGPLPIVGQVAVTDRFEQNAAVSLNQFATALVWPFTQVSPQTSGTGSTALQKRYWGVSDKNSLEADDLLLLDTDFSSQKNQSNTFNTVDQYIYVIYPSTMGTAIINMNGTITTDWLLTVVAFNAITYNVYRSSIPLTGLFQITVL